MNQSKSHFDFDLRLRYLHVTSSLL